MVFCIKKDKNFPPHSIYKLPQIYQIIQVTPNRLEQVLNGFDRHANNEIFLCTVDIRSA